MKKYLHIMPVGTTGWRVLGENVKFESLKDYFDLDKENELLEGKTLVHKHL